MQNQPIPTKSAFQSKDISGRAAPRASVEAKTVMNQPDTSPLASRYTAEPADSNKIGFSW
jgi:hypothetical protein